MAKQKNNTLIVLAVIALIIVVSSNLKFEGALIPSTTYYYKVSAVDANGLESTLSDVVSGTTKAAIVLTPDVLITLPKVSGNGVVESGETCDDGNTVSGDGCSSTMTIETGFNCASPTGLMSSASYSGTALNEQFGDYGAIHFVSNGDWASTLQIQSGQDIFENAGGVQVNGPITAEFAGHPTATQSYSAGTVTVVVAGISSTFSTPEVNIAPGTGNRDVLLGSVKSTCSAVACTPNWVCLDWSSCDPSGSQYRSCTDSNNCGTEAGKPITQQGCSYQQQPVDLCGNGWVDGGETCDSSFMWSFQTCYTPEGYWGTKGCDADCHGWKSTCNAIGKLGDNIINGPEACDGTALGTATCVSQGFASGTLACKADGTFDTSGCVSPPTQTLGNNIAEGTEVCDGTDIGTATCVTQGFYSGDLKCAADGMSYDTALCVLSAPTSGGGGGGGGAVTAANMLTPQQVAAIQEVRKTEAVATTEKTFMEKFNDLSLQQKLLIIAAIAALIYLIAKRKRR